MIIAVTGRCKSCAPNAGAPADNPAATGLFSVGLGSSNVSAWCHLLIILGGANAQEETGIELLRTFDWVNYAYVGESEALLPGQGRRVGLAQALTARRRARNLAPTASVFHYRQQLLSLSLCGGAPCRLRGTKQSDL